MSLIVHVKKKYKGFSLDVSFQTDGERLGILGPSGSGKSMTLKMIAGIERPDEGFISLNGRTLFDSAKSINVSPQQRKVGYLFQQYALFPNMTVSQNIQCGLAGTEKQGWQKVIGEMIRRFQLEGMENRYPHQLSGGQQQRVALARCLAANPELILLDEPFSALDAHLREQVALEMKAFLDQYPGESILVSHNRDEIYALCPNLLVLNHGNAMGCGSTQALFHRPVSVDVARLTGCKNISPIKREDDRTFLATDWDIRFQVETPIPDNATHVGIRAHDIQPVGGGAPASNEFGGEICQIQEGLFERTILLKTSPKAKTSLWWKADRTLWMQSETKIPPTLFFVRPENLMMLADDGILKTNDTEDNR
jgi:molybdate transport system ATP-binding protein